MYEPAPYALFKTSPLCCKCKAELWTFVMVKASHALAPDALQTIEDPLATSVGAGKSDRDDNRDRLDFERDPDFHR